MPNVSELKKSSFITRAEVGAGVLATITNCEQVNIAKDGAPQELKWCLNFKEIEKPLVLNSTNGQIIAAFSGIPNTDDWAGVKVVLYDDPNVSFGGKLVGGIRCRAPRPQTAKPLGLARSAATVALPPPVIAPAAEHAGVGGESDQDVPF